MQKFSFQNYSNFRLVTVITIICFKKSSCILLSTFHSSYAYYTELSPNPIFLIPIIMRCSSKTKQYLTHLIATKHLVILSLFLFAKGNNLFLLLLFFKHERQTSYNLTNVFFSHLCTRKEVIFHRHVDYYQ